LSNIGWPTPVELTCAAGRMPALWRAPAIGRDNACNLLFVPPFAEEMNRTRRLMSLVGQGLASRGVGSLLPDLPGTGDSDGAFADAGWPEWRDAVACAATHLAGQGAPVLLMGFRLGCLLALDALATGLAVRSAILVAPVDSGRQHLRHWLRVRAAASLESGQRVSVGDLQKRLEQGETVECAGYELSPALAAAIAHLDYGPLLAATTVPVVRVEVGTAPDGVHTAPGRRHVAAPAPWLLAEPGEPSLLADTLTEIVLEVA
jgi:exosortase A-associated hydrolase 2